MRPVFPPSEEFYVGDVYAAAFGDAKSQLLFRSIKLAHIDKAAQVVNDDYKMLPVFPQTPPNFDGSTIVQADHDIFAPEPVRRSLPIMAFPDFVVATASARNAGSGLLGRLDALLGFAQTAAENVQIKLPEAETYGITTAQARDLFDDFCKTDASTPNPLCTQTVLRRIISSMVGGDILCLNDPARPKNGTLPDYVGISVVERVYLTRSIDYEYGADTAVAAAARAGIKGAATVPSGAVASGGTDQPKLTDVTDAAREQIAQLGPGGTVTLASVTSNGAVLKRTFVRPVVIGYEPFWKNPIDDGCVLKPAQTAPTPR
jgi:hypothetical protein